MDGRRGNALSGFGSNIRSATIGCTISFTTGGIGGASDDATCDIVVWAPTKLKIPKNISRDMSFLVFL